ncbi:Di-copper centre-containing protein [Westerdykella ornata]|uniref:Di-copper centre-containing protein n=1 Tax=Westerdykella ornata TaxID=318751 RepID=A0A6A6J6X7_WESOR|nr:Di-copper centre-containing protein [Westerdykella ornata]KAF2272331.1 Di-copper centre-containing protein [Westerdykella ornata]
MIASVVVLAATAFTFASAACTAPAKRVAWQDMKAADKEAYLKATTCLLSSPAKTKLPGVKTRWDDLASLHQLHALQIHSTGLFLPYHRYFLHVHEHLVRECGYQGPMSYWDEPRDAGSFSKSTVLDGKLGFGGSGKGSKNCLADGPFVNATVNIGPGFKTDPRCVNRKITDNLSTLTGKSYVERALNGEEYWAVQDAIYSGPHLMGHAALAMMDGDSITSAGDPLFMLHHGFVDKMWSDWQAASPARLTAISGPNAQDPNVGFSEFPGGIEEESKMWGKPTPAMLAVMPDPQSGDGGPTTTLNHVFTSFGILADVHVKDIMDTRGGYLCYVYA